MPERNTSTRPAGESMTDKFTLEQIREFWTQQASRHGQQPAASWSDAMVIEMEVRQILRYLSDGDHILDVGCANGYSTLQFASQRAVHIRGLDYIPEMIRQARNRLGAMTGALPGVADFIEGDVTALPEPSGQYDKVVCIRVLINLGNWERQLQGLRECARVLRPGGMLLLSEATLQGWQRLNAFRREWRLPDIPMPRFNQYLDEAQVIQAVAPELRLRDLVNFASSYYVATRVLKPLLAHACGPGIDAADPDMEWNRWSSQLPPWGDYGTQKLFVFDKQ